MLPCPGGEVYACCGRVSGSKVSSDLKVADPKSWLGINFDFVEFPFMHDIELLTHLLVSLTSPAPLPHLPVMLPCAHPASQRPSPKSYPVLLLQVARVVHSSALFGGHPNLCQLATSGPLWTEEQEKMFVESTCHLLNEHTCFRRDQGPQGKPAARE